MLVNGFSQNTKIPFSQQKSITSADRLYKEFADLTLAKSTEFKVLNPSGKKSSRSGGGPPFAIVLAIDEVPHGGASHAATTLSFLRN